MFFTLLYSSPILKNNIHREMYIYIIGTILYTIIHWALFSNISKDINFIQTYRKFFYAIPVVDLLCVKHLLDKKRKITCDGDTCRIDKSGEHSHKANSDIIISEKKEMMHKKETEQINDTQSCETIPVYVPQKIRDEMEAKRNN